MNLGRIATINVFRKIQQFERLIKPAGLLTQKCNPTQFTKSMSSLTNRNCTIIRNTTNNSESYILSKLSAQSRVSITQTRTVSAEGDHVRLWIIEKLVSISFLAIIPAAFLFESKIIDTILAAAIVMHTHWGLEAILIDYARPIVVGTMVPKMAFFMLNLLSVVTLAGLLVLIYNGPGFTKIIKQGWAIDKNRNNAN